MGKNIIILGGGTAGTMIANNLAKKLPGEHHITVVDQDNKHIYQPGLLFLPFGKMSAKRLVKSRKRFLPRAARFIQGEVVDIDRERRVVTMAGGSEHPWDHLIITTGTVPRPDQVEGMADGALWHTKVFDFYTLDGATALRAALAKFTSGRLVVHITEMPIKCPVAPLEFALLAQDYMRQRGRHQKVDISYVTPLDGAFTKPIASKLLGNLFAERGIDIVPDFQIASIDNAAREIVSFDGRRVGFDLLVTVPPNRGAQVIADCHLGDDVGFVPIDKHTLQSTADPDIWVVGDAGNAPTSKAGSVAHFMVESFIPNFIAHLNGEPPTETFDGHANCFIESGRNQAMLLDFNYDTEPLPGTFPLATWGPMKLLGRSIINHLSKLAFEAVYWLLLVPGRKLPFHKDMSMTGKIVPPGSTVSGH
jgi:sulfide:quinone oxidoreductase